MPLERRELRACRHGAGNIVDIDPEAGAHREELVVGREFERLDRVRALPKASRVTRVRSILNQASTKPGARGAAHAQVRIAPPLLLRTACIS